MDDHCEGCGTVLGAGNATVLYLRPYLDVCYEVGNIILVEDIFKGVGGCVNIKFPGGHVAAEHDAVLILVCDGHFARPDLQVIMCHQVDMLVSAQWEYQFQILNDPEELQHLKKLVSPVLVFFLVLCSGCGSECARPCPSS